MGELERRIKEGWFDDIKKKAPSVIEDIIHTIMFFGYWIGSTLYFFHSAFPLEDRNVLTLLGSITMGWCMMPLMLVIQFGVWLSNIHINF